MKSLFILEVVRRTDARNVAVNRLQWKFDTKEERDAAEKAAISRRWIVVNKSEEITMTLSDALRELDSVDHLEKAKGKR